MMSEKIIDKRNELQIKLLEAAYTLGSPHGHSHKRHPIAAILLAGEDVFIATQQFKWGHTPFGITLHSDELKEDELISNSDKTQIEYLTKKYEAIENNIEAIWQRQNEITRSVENLGIQLIEKMNDLSINTEIDSEQQVKFDQYYDQLNESIILSRLHILNLKNNWDGEGGKRYKEATFNQAVTFIRTVFRRIWREYKIFLSLPAILPGDDGSIDVHWKDSKFELLITFPNDPSERVAVYGDNYDDTDIISNIAVEKINDVLISWLRVLYQ